MQANTPKNKQEVTDNLKSFYPTIVVSLCQANAPAIADKSSYININGNMLQFVKKAT